MTKLCLVNIFLFSGIFCVIQGNKIGDICDLRNTTGHIGKIGLIQNCQYLVDLDKNHRGKVKFYRVVKDKNPKSFPAWFCCPLRKSEAFCYEYKSNLIDIKGATVKYSTQNRRQKRIIHGNRADVGEFPFFAELASVTDKKLNFNCAGSLISSKFILTAAHCINAEKPPIIARLGTVSLITSADHVDHDIVRRFIHDDYSPRSNYHDIGLLQLKNDVQFSILIQPACLMQPSMSTSMKSTTSFSIAGFGKTENAGLERSEHLMKAEIYDIKVEKCTNFYYKNVTFNGFSQGIRNDTIMCGFNPRYPDINTCQGDSGSAVTWKSRENVDYVVAITTSGLTCGNKPSFYTKVTAYLDWIEDIVWK